ncbi:MAG: YfhO family protein [Singulisphaera sp.]
MRFVPGRWSTMRGRRPRHRAPDPAVYRDRAERQVRQVRTFYPSYLRLAAGHLLVLAALSEALRRGRLTVRAARVGVMGLTLIDVFAFGFGLNPAIARGGDRPEVAVIAHLRREGGRSGRIVALGEELPPNVAMRYGLADVRNYDSVELARSLDWFAPLYSPGPEASTSRRGITWEGVIRARDRLREAAVTAVVGPTPPPAGAFDRVDRVGSVWVARLDGHPWATSMSNRAALRVWRASGIVDVEADLPAADRIVMRDTFDPGWVATVDGEPVAIEPFRGTFLSVPVVAGRHSISLRYAPREVEVALVISLSAAAAIVFTLTGISPFRSTRILAQGLGRTQAIGLESMT